ncbi:MAG: prolyl-tRNA synthetase associated domain-containing protein [Pseudomonadota bacterium]
MSEDAPSGKALFERLDALGVQHRTVEHPAFFTVEESRAFKTDMPGGHSKNLFLKDKKGALSLAVAHAETKVDLVGLGRVMAAKGRLSFGKPELMREVLGVEPGSVTPFALINGGAPNLSWVALDRTLMAHNPVWFHPLHNAASTAISPDGLLAFLKSCGVSPQILDFAAPEAAA